MGRSGVGESSNIHAAPVPQGFSMVSNLNPAMNSLPSIALSGMQAAQAAMNASAHNVANLQTPQLRRQEVLQTERAGGGVDAEIRRSDQEGASLETDLVAQLQAQNAFLANLAVFRTADRLAGAVLDTYA